MALDSFVFTITLPRDASLLALLNEVSGHMSAYLDLPEDEARDARGVLERLVAERLAQPDNGTGPISVRFERPNTAMTVTVEVRSSGRDGTEREGGAPSVDPAGHNGQPPVHLSWRLREDR